MKIQYLKNAGIIVEHAGTRILCDPWLTDGAYYGSWSHFPPLQMSPADVTDVDYIYISHVHPDHLDPGTLRAFASDTPILIYDFAEKFVSRIIGSLGFENITEIGHGQRYELGPEFTMEVLAADSCDPEVCGRLFDCVVPRPYDRSLQVDSMAVFQGGDRVLVNSNDCPFPIARSACERIVREYGEIDFLGTGYSGAGPFPQCFEAPDEETVLRRAAMKREQFLSQSLGYLRLLKPNFFMPFAGQYVLGGRLTGLNRLRGVPEVEELPAEYARRLADEPVDSELVLLNEGESFDLDSGSASAPFRPDDPVERQRYLDEVLAKRKFSYENGAHIPPENWVDLSPKLIEPHARMQRYQDKYGGHRSNWTVYLDTGQDHLYGIPFDHKREVHKEQRQNELEPFIRLSVDYTLMSQILERKAHWNNSELGSHLRYARSPDQYDRGTHHFLSYLHG